MLPLQPIAMPSRILKFTTDFALVVIAFWSGDGFQILYSGIQNMAFSFASHNIHVDNDLIEASAPA